MGLFSNFKKTSEEKVRDYAVSIMESVYASSLSVAKKKGSYFLSAFSGNPVSYTWQRGTVAEAFMSALKNQLDYIKSNRFTKFFGRDKEILCKLLYSEYLWIDSQLDDYLLHNYQIMGMDKLNNLENSIINNALHWNAPLYPNKYSMVPAKVSLTRKFDEMLQQENLD